ncbi:MAG: hypothetical protein WBC06_04840 [Chitinophagaceae bacterium]
MLPEGDLQQSWLQLETAFMKRMGKKPDLDDILVFIGIREAGLPPKSFTENELKELKQMAINTILAPARYYELMWVDATGWPHFKLLKPLPEMSIAEKENFLKEYVLLYAADKKLI